jgi:hypothetical protein
MTKALNTPRLLQALVIGLIMATPALGQGGRGCPGMTDPGCPGMMGDGAHAADMPVLHQLFAHRTEVTRRVVLRPDGIETVTESTNPEVTRLLQTHVASMLARVEEQRAIHLRDPLFAELFRYADRIEATHELTSGGVRVVETSKDAYVVKLLQAHAEVVSAFIANGMSEMMKNHPLPTREP